MKTEVADTQAAAWKSYADALHEVFTLLMMVAGFGVVSVALALVMPELVRHGRFGDLLCTLILWVPVTELAAVPLVSLCLGVWRVVTGRGVESVLDAVRSRRLFMVRI